MLAGSILSQHSTLKHRVNMILDAGGASLSVAISPQDWKETGRRLRYDRFQPCVLIVKACIRAVEIFHNISGFERCVTQHTVASHLSSDAKGVIGIEPTI